MIFEIKPKKQQNLFTAYQLDHGTIFHFKKDERNGAVQPNLCMRIHNGYMYLSGAHRYSPFLFEDNKERKTWEVVTYKEINPAVIQEV